MNIRHTHLVGLTLLILIGCGGPQSGTFADSPVEGLAYETATLSGTTDAEGKFEYEEGETVTFSLGGLELGATVGKEEVSPVDIIPDLELPEDSSELNRRQLGP